ncbi:MAG: hypothetical protein AMJ92_00670 [candidate division Zixibacteria bacterium SM23_81]|nr:MAG: hypothetical protein AMJ92_00670 [candidate division Zixibacteria bacterium SM23_81]
MTFSNQEVYSQRSWPKLLLDFKKKIFKNHFIIVLTILDDKAWDEKGTSFKAKFASLVKNKLISRKEACVGDSKFLDDSDTSLS